MSDLFSLEEKVKTEEHRNNISESLRSYYANGGVPWNKGKHGVQKNPKWTDEQKKAHSMRMKGRKNPWMVEVNKRLKTGWKYTDEHRRKLSESVKLARDSYAPIWNKGLTKEDHPSIVQMAKTMSENTKGIPRPFKSNKQGTRRFWYYGDGIRIKMRSRWEVAYAKYLDGEGLDWLYEYCTFVMDEFSYTPDFYLVSENAFYEIKGYMDEVCKNKFDKFRRHFGCKLKVLRQEDLEILGVLDRSGRVA